MKKIKTTAIAGTVKAPFVKKTFEHYNEAIEENDNAIMRALIPTAWATGNIVKLFGSVVTASIPGTSSITAGAAYYNGEIYLIDANASLVTTGSQTLVWVVETTYASGDPVQYSDGNSYDQHEIRKLKLQAGASGSGLMNYNASTVRNFEDGITSIFLDGLRREIINIGNWDMDATTTVTVNHPFPDNSTFRSVTAFIVDDADSSVYPLDSYCTTFNDGRMNGGIKQVTDAVIELSRTPSGDFDSTAFNDGTINRGWIIIEYTA
jgi:hypothetical protein